MSRIVPTVGRIIHFYPDKRWYEDALPRAAMIAAVGPKPHHVNLTVFEPDGTGSTALDVPVIQDGDQIPPAGKFACWMPYQIGQAQETEELQRALKPPGTIPPIDPGVPEFVAPRVTEGHIDSLILGATYYNPPGTTVTACFMRLANGTVVTGTSACVSPENFNTKMGMDLAYKDAKRQVWALEGYLLAERMWIGRGKTPLGIDGIKRDN